MNINFAPWLIYWVMPHLIKVCYKYKVYQ